MPFSVRSCYQTICTVLKELFVNSLILTFFSGICLSIMKPKLFRDRTYSVLEAIHILTYVTIKCC